MPAIRIRKPLRERCNVKLNVKTAIPTSVDNDYYFRDDHTRGRAKACKPILYTNTSPSSNAQHASWALTTPRLHAIHTPTTEGMSSLHQLVPYIYVGCYDGAHLPRSLVSEDGALFTHIVKITHASETRRRKAGHRDLQFDLARGLYCLGLVVPGPDDVTQQDVDVDDRTKSSKPNAQGGAKIRLTEEQLLLTRDFLSLALPYHSQAHPHEDIPCASADSVRVLVTAPAGPRAAADVMAVAVCYLAFASGERAETVLEYVEVEREVPRVWKEALGGKGKGVGKGEGDNALAVVQRVARHGE